MCSVHLQEEIITCGVSSKSVPYQSLKTSHEQLSYNQNDKQNYLMIKIEKGKTAYLIELQ